MAKPTRSGSWTAAFPLEEVLAEMRTSDPPIYYLVGTPKGRLTKLEAELGNLAEWLGNYAEERGQIPGAQGPRRLLA
jgi:hypothetical protein